MYNDKNMTISMKIQMLTAQRENLVPVNLEDTPM